GERLTERGANQLPRSRSNAFEFAQIGHAGERAPIDIAFGKLPAKDPLRGQFRRTLLNRDRAAGKLNESDQRLQKAVTHLNELQQSQTSGIGRFDPIGGIKLTLAKADVRAETADNNVARQEHTQASQAHDAVIQEIIEKAGD
ncbi:MAG: hypothetical protein AAF585_16465, partial [Verrucomicrobiota bacterium]